MARFIALIFLHILRTNGAWKILWQKVTFFTEIHRDNQGVARKKVEWLSSISPRCFLDLFFSGLIVISLRHPPPDLPASVVMDGRQPVLLSYFLCGGCCKRGCTKRRTTQDITPLCLFHFFASSLPTVENFGICSLFERDEATLSWLLIVVVDGLPYILL